MKKFVLLCTLLFIFVLFFTFFKKEDVKKEPEKKIVENVNTKASMIMVGDVLIHNSVYEDAYSNGSYDFSKMFSDIAPIVKEYDLAFYNQESIIGGKSLGLSSYPRFNSPEEIGDTMINMGFNMVSLANNHTLDKNSEGVINSTNYWKDKNVLTAGSYSSLEDRNKVIVKEINGIKYGLLAYTTTTNGLTTENEYYVNVFNEDSAKKDIQNIRAKVDVLFVSMHWGTEYTHNPTSEELSIANFLADQDVDVVIGHHPHVVQPITYINDTLVIYSLGNFISAQEGEAKLVGAMVSLDINKTSGEKVSVKISNVDHRLVYTYYRNWRNYKVIPFENLNDDLLPKYSSIKDKYDSIINQYNYKNQG